MLEQKDKKPIFKNPPRMFERNMLAEIAARNEMKATFSRVQNNPVAAEKVFDCLKSESFMADKVENNDRKMKEFSRIRAEIRATKSSINKVLYLLPKLKRAARITAHWQIVEEESKEVVLEMISKMRAVTDFQSGKRIIIALKNVEKRHVDFPGAYEILIQEMYLLKARVILFQKNKKRRRKRIQPKKK